MWSVEAAHQTTTNVLAKVCSCLQCSALRKQVRWCIRAQRHRCPQRCSIYSQKLCKQSHYHSIYILLVLHNFSEYPDPIVRSSVLIMILHDCTILLANIL